MVSTTTTGTNIPTFAQTGVNWNYCPTCGRRLQPGWNFCAGCGTATRQSLQQADLWHYPTIVPLGGGYNGVASGYEGTVTVTNSACL